MPTQRVFSTAKYSIEQRADSWRKHLQGSLFDADYRALDSNGIVAEHAWLQLDPFMLHSFAINKHMVDRTQVASRSASPKLFFTVVVSGRATFWTSDRMEIADPGDVLVYDPDDPFFIAFHDGTRELLFEIDQDQLPGDCAIDTTLLRKLHAEELEKSGLTTQEFQRIFADLGMSAGQSRGVQQAAGRSMSILARSAVNAVTPGYFADARDVIASNIANPELSIDVVAKALNVSTRHLSRAFNNQGLTFTKFVTRERVNRAADLLRQTNLSVTNIAIACGFRSISQFSRTFAAIKHQSPSDYRRS